jgi:DNA-binding CsgD family transcriptional regulator
LFLGRVVILKAGRHENRLFMAGVSDSRGRLLHEAQDRIYEAAFDASAFADLSSVVANVMQAANGVVFLAHNGLPIEVSATTSKEAQQDYLAYYGRIDVWTPPTREVAPFLPMRSQNRISDDEVLNSEFYRDYARHLDMWHPMGTYCMLAPDLALMVAVNRTRTGRVFNKEEGARLIELTRHVQRALQMRGRFQGSQARAQAGFAAIDNLAFAAIVVDAGGRITFANAKAEDLAAAGAGLTLCGGRIGCTVQRQAREFNDLIRSAASGGAGGAMRLTDAAGAAALLTLVSPMPNRLREPQNGAGLALVAARPEKDSPAFAETIVSQLFGLSRSEAQVACAVVAGASLDEIAAQRGVKITTIKSQIEAAFRKTETESQRDLVRLIGKLPQLL